MDFSQILDSWENRGHRRDQQPFDKDKEHEAAPLPTRAEMERAATDDELDLHGLKGAEAVEAVKLFLRESRLEGCRKLRIIHGKGLHSEGQRAVLKDAVGQVLSKDRNVAAWGEAGRKEGGSGASWVWLKPRSEISARGK